MTRKPKPTPPSGGQCSHYAPVHAARKVFPVELVDESRVPATAQAIDQEDKVARGSFEVIDVCQGLHGCSWGMAHHALVHFSHVL